MLDKSLFVLLGLIILFGFLFSFVRFPKTNKMRDKRIEAKKNGNPTLEGLDEIKVSDRL